MQTQKYELFRHFVTLPVTYLQGVSDFYTNFGVEREKAIIVGENRPAVEVKC